MGFSQAAPSWRKAFVFTEYMEEGNFEAHSCGNGRFIPGAPSADLEVCFKIYKTQNLLHIQIHEANLRQWLCAIPALRDDLDDDLFHDSIGMALLLPHYPEISAKFDQDIIQGHSFDALELFVCHFLREGSVFATLGFEHLHEEQILTDQHFHDIQSQNRSISEDLDLLDEAIDEIDERNIKGSGHPLLVMNEPFRSQLQDAITRRDPIDVDKVLTLDPGFVDAKTLCLAIRYCEWTVFRLLLKHGAQVDEFGCTAKLLYHAAKAGRMDAVQLLLNYGANKEGGDSYIKATPLTGAASGGHLEIVRYLIEEKGANIDGSRYKSPLSRAIKHRHAHIIDYLLKARANVCEENYFELLSQIVETKKTVYGGILERSIASISNDVRDVLFSRVVSKGHLEVVRYLVEAGANVDHATWLVAHSSPLAVAVSNGQLKIVRCLVEAGANVNPDTGYRAHPSPLTVAVSNGHLEIVRCLVEAGANVNPDTRHRQQYSPLAEALMSRRHKVAQFLSSNGAKLLKSEVRFRPRHRLLLIKSKISNCNQIGELPRNIERSAAIDEKDCPAVAAIQTQERKTMARRLLAKIASSCEKLLDAGTIQGASASLIAFIDQVGTSSSVWRSGTRAIRDIYEGYMPRGLSDIVNALQVANAMRSVVPPSNLVCSKKEFVNDIPRWAALLSPDDQRLFFEIASLLWGIPASTTSQEGAGKFVRPLVLLQDLVNRLVRTSELFDQRSRNSCGSYRLQTLRQQYPFAMNYTHKCEARLLLAEWRPLPTQGEQESLHTNAPKPPDPEGEQFGILARITVLMAGAIFGAILLYLCLSRYGFSTRRLPILISDDGQVWASDQIIARNYVILAMYLGLTSLVDFGSWKSTDNLLLKLSPLSLVLPDSPHTESVQEQRATVQSSYEADYIMADSPSTADTILKHAPADCSPSVSSHLTTSPSTTVISPSTISTATHGSPTMGTWIDGTICCEHCKSKFKLGKNGRRGQASNLQKHMKNHHPETIPNYHRVIYNCCYGCGARDPNRSNIKVHENKYCANRKGKQPRSHSKWRQATTGGS